jgi:hypothetical protein
LSPIYISTTVRYALYFYFKSRSFRLAARCLEFIVKRVMYLFGNRWFHKYAGCAADRFGTDNKRLVKKMFVDEILLLQIDDDLNYWL